MRERESEDVRRNDGSGSAGNEGRGSRVVTRNERREST